MRKKEIKGGFTSKGQIVRQRGRRPLMDELGRQHSFLDKLENIDPAAMSNVIEKLYNMAIDSENEIVATRCCEIILAYGMGKPATVDHEPNRPMHITFTRASSPAKRIDGDSFNSNIKS